MATKLVIGNCNYSSWSLRAWWATRRSGLEFENIGLQLDTPQFDREIARYSPSRCVPVLHHNGLAIWDTLAICEYLAELNPDAKLWPDSAPDRARARSICAEMHAGFTALKSQLPMNCRARNRKVEIDSACATDISRVIAIWTECLEQSDQDRPWLFGQWSIADAFYAPVAMRFRTYGIGIEEPAARWVKAVLDDPDIRKWVAWGENESWIIAADEAGS
jgi:glutathione S-transferase